MTALLTEIAFYRDERIHAFLVSFDCRSARVSIRLIGPWLCQWLGLRHRVVGLSAAPQ